MWDLVTLPVPLHILTCLGPSASGSFPASPVETRMKEVVKSCSFRGFCCAKSIFFLIEKHTLLLFNNEKILYNISQLKTVGFFFPHLNLCHCYKPSTSRPIWIYFHHPRSLPVLSQGCMDINSSVPTVKHFPGVLVKCFLLENQQQCPGLCVLNLVESWKRAGTAACQGLR